MDSFEINKIVAAILMVALLIIGIGKISDVVFHVEKPEAPGYSVDGPAWYNVVGRKVGGVSDYKYSKALAGYDKVWDFEELNGFLLKPAKWIKGTKMAYAGLRKEKDRASIIKYLNDNSDNPLALP